MPRLARCTRLALLFVVCFTVRALAESDQARIDRESDNFNTWCAQNEKEGREAFNRQWSKYDKALADLNARLNPAPSSEQAARDALEQRVQAAAWAQARRDAEAATNRRLDLERSAAESRIRSAVNQLDAYVDSDFGTAIERVGAVCDLVDRRYMGADHDSVDHLVTLRLRIPRLLEQAHEIARGNPAHVAHVFYLLESSITREGDAAVKDYPAMLATGLTATPALGFAGLIVRYQAEGVRKLDHMTPTQRELLRLNAQVLGSIGVDGWRELVPAPTAEIRVGLYEAFAAALRGAFLDGPIDFNPSAALAENLARDAGWNNKWMEHWGQWWDASRLKYKPTGSLPKVELPKVWIPRIADLFLLPTPLFGRWAAQVRLDRASGTLPAPAADLTALLEAVSAQRWQQEGADDQAEAQADLASALHGDVKSFAARAPLDQVRLQYVGNPKYVIDHPNVVLRAALTGDFAAMKALTGAVGGGYWPADPVKSFDAALLGSERAKAVVEQLRAAYCRLHWQRVRETAESDLGRWVADIADLRAMAAYEPAAAQLLAKVEAKYADFFARQALEAQQAARQAMVAELFAVHFDTADAATLARLAHLVPEFGAEEVNGLDLDLRLNFLGRVVAAAPQLPAWAADAAEAFAEQEPLQGTNRENLRRLLDRIGDGDSAETQAKRLALRAHIAGDEAGALQRIEALKPAGDSPLADLRASLVAELALRAKPLHAADVQHAIDLQVRLLAEMSSDHLHYSEPLNLIPALFEAWHTRGTQSDEDAAAERKAEEGFRARLSAGPAALAALADAAQQELLQARLTKPATTVFYRALREHPGAAATAAFRRFQEKRPDWEKIDAPARRVAAYVLWLWQTRDAKGPLPADSAKEVMGIMRDPQANTQSVSLDLTVFGADADFGWIGTRALLAVHRQIHSLVLPDDFTAWQQALARLPAVSTPREYVDDLVAEMRAGRQRVQARDAALAQAEAQLAKEQASDEARTHRLVAIRQEADADLALDFPAEDELGALAVRNGAGSAEARAALLANLGYLRTRTCVVDGEFAWQPKFVALRVRWQEARAKGATAEEAAREAVKAAQLTPSQVAAAVLALTRHEATSPYDDAELSEPPFLLPPNREFNLSVMAAATATLPQGEALRAAVAHGHRKDFPSTKDQWTSLATTGWWDHGESTQ